MLTEPRPALAEQSNFHHALVGLAGLAALVHVLAPDEPSAGDSLDEPDDFVYLLLGVASLGETVERLGRTGQPPRSAEPPAEPAAGPPRSTPGHGWLR
ncbi:MAG TPA: hypothetical protein VFE65_01135 [Pseudonocardia sp.]|jgi:hypothetical protein|nr:hypothetical protein [Pseudonocardia sp.]